MAVRPTNLGKSASQVERATRPDRRLPPIQPSRVAKTPSGRPVSWLDGFAGTPQRMLSGHLLRVALNAAGAPLTLASPLPTVSVLAVSGQLSNNTWVTAATIECSGVRVVNFYLKNTDTNENGILARPFRIIDSEKFIDDEQDPYIVFDGFGVRIPIVCDCAVVGLEVKDFVGGSHAKYTVGVGFTPA